MAYYYLRCETCKEDFKPMVATSREELTVPDYEVVEAQIGITVRDRFEDFHRKHMGHELAALELP